MSETLTVAEMHARYASEWLLVGEPQTGETLQVQAGKLLFHSKDRDEVYRKAIELRPKRFAMVFTGTIPKDTVIVL